MDKFFSVEELAKSGDTTARAVRLYIDKGLLEPMRIGRVICFPEEAQRTLQKIRRAKRLGFSLDEIKACQTDKDLSVLTSAIRRVEQLISDGEEEVSDLRRRLANTSRKETTK